MDIIEKLAFSLGERGEQANVALAESIVGEKNKEAVTELVQALSHKNKNIQSDALKTLYEIGDRSPEMIAPYFIIFLGLLSSKNNRLQWGAMAALESIAGEDPELTFKSLPQILKASDIGSVITKDGSMKILAKLGSLPKYQEDISPLLLEQIQKAPENQFPSYAEWTATVIAPMYLEKFKKLISERLEMTEAESKRKRLTKLLKKLK